MLIRFNVSNFLSFNEMQEFSMIGGKVRNKINHILDDDKLKLLKFAAVYGANASGKSNLISAMAFAKNTIVKGIPDGYTKSYYKNLIGNKNLPSYFEFEIRINNNYYSYGFEIVLNESRIVSEWLVELSPDGNDKNIYVRNVEEKTFEISGYFKHKDIINRLNVYAQDNRSNDTKLFLTIMNTDRTDLYIDNSELSILKDVYDWFIYKLDINYPDEPISNYSYFVTEKDTEEICRIISAFGTGISSFKVVEMENDRLLSSISKSSREEIMSELESIIIARKKTGKANNSKGILYRSPREFIIFEIQKDDTVTVKTIEFEHFNSNALFSLSEESDGTIRLLDLIEVLLSNNEEKIYVIDEIDRCLHPQLTYKLIEAYFQLSKNSSRQLIVTTHESYLLDFDLLRRDEIWFVDKNKSGQSMLYSLEAYNERFDKKIDKAYFDGRYGGIPIFSSVFPMKEG